jgi:hypothetical protein
MPFSDAPRLVEASISQNSERLESYDGQMHPNPIMKPLRDECEMPLLSRCELQQRLRVHRFDNRLGNLTDVRTITFGIL